MIRLYSIVSEVILIIFVDGQFFRLIKDQIFFSEITI